MNIVTKATSRKRGVAKTVRAAQKTPLPGDAVTETIPDADAPADNLDAMSLTELRRLAVAQGWSTGTKGGKREIIELLRKHPDGPPKSAKAQPAQAVTESESKVDPKRAAAIGKRMVELRKEYTRGVLAEAAQTTPSIIWRWEQGRPKPDELVMVEALLAKIDAGEITKPERKVFGAAQSGPTKQKMTDAIEQVRHILSDVPTTGLKVGQARSAISSALDVIEKTMSAV